MDNPYIQLTREFNHGRLRAILASGQAVVLYRLAIVSKDGDWILKEEAEMEDPRLQAPYSRSARDLMKLAEAHPAAVLGAVLERPLLSRIGQGREEVERLLDEERRSLIRKNEVRLDRYVDAAARWAAEWSRVSKEMAGRPLAEAHEIMVEGAAEHLPREP